MAMKTLEELLEENKLDLKTMIVFRKAERTIRSIEQRVIKENKLTPTQFSVLETLYSKGRMRIQDLIDHMLATSGNMTVVIKNMVRDGLISRTSDPNDRRSYLIELSQKSRLNRRNFPSTYPVCKGSTWNFIRRRQRDSHCYFKKI